MDLLSLSPAWSVYEALFQKYKDSETLSEGWGPCLLLLQRRGRDWVPIIHMAALQPVPGHLMHSGFWAPAMSSQMHTPMQTLKWIKF